MSIPRLYCPLELESGRTVSLDKATSHHLTTVLRAKPAESVCLFNGDGHDYIAIIETTGKSASVRVDEKHQNRTESPLQTCLIQGLSRGDRMDFTVQKSVELGINRIVVFHADKSGKRQSPERQQKKQHHWEAIVRSAAQQSGRSFLPQIEYHPELSAAITHASCFAANRQESNVRARWMLVPESKQSLASFAGAQHDTTHATILIGPESGLTEGEMQLANEHEFASASIGPRILRTETAVVTALSVLQTLAGDLA